MKKYVVGRGRIGRYGQEQALTNPLKALIWKPLNNTLRWSFCVTALRFTYRYVSFDFFRIRSQYKIIFLMSTERWSFCWEKSPSLCRKRSASSCFQLKSSKSNDTGRWGHTRSRWADLGVSSIMYVSSTLCRLEVSLQFLYRFPTSPCLDPQEIVDLRNRRFTVH